MNMKKIVIILSGGMDSTTLLYYLLDKGYEVEAISFDYGQKHLKEVGRAKSICAVIGVSHTIIDMSSMGEHLQSSLTQDEEIPEGHYTDETMKSTVVPHRNLIMLSIANAIGLSKGIDTIAFAAHAGDHTIYPDCRRSFASIAELDLATSSDNYDIRVLCPFISIDKTDILRMGLKLKVPYEKTWTCYKGDEKSCGKCGTCVERLEAFEECGVKDPLEYE